MPTKKPTRVILDSSILFVPAQFNVDIFEELERVINQKHELVILSATYKELQKIAKDRGTKLSRQAELALRLAQKCRQISVEKRDLESHDDVIVRVASERTWIVATNDRVLRRRLRKNNVPVIYLRQKSRLSLEGAI